MTGRSVGLLIGVLSILACDDRTDLAVAPKGIANPSLNSTAVSPGDPNESVADVVEAMVAAAPLDSRERLRHFVEGGLANGAVFVTKGDGVASAFVRRLNAARSREQMAAFTKTPALHR